MHRTTWYLYYILRASVATKSPNMGVRIVVHMDLMQHATKLNWVVFPTPGAYCIQIL